MATEGYVNEQMMNARRKLLEEGTYLGAGKTENHPRVKWARMGSTDYVTFVNTDKPGASDSGEGGAHTSSLSSPMAPPPAVLTMVIQISEDNYWLTPCGMWKEPTDMANTLADVKLSCIGEVPKHDIFAPDFKNVVENLSTIRKAKFTKGYPKQVGILLPGEERIKFRHVLFQKKQKREAEKDEESETASSDSKEVPVEYTIPGWPSDYPEAEDELRGMVNTHRVNYVDAYDIQGKRIKPGDYRKRLQGALVLMRFTMTHWAFKAKPGQLATDTFVADIVSIRMLKPAEVPKKLASQKRKFQETDPDILDMNPKEFKTFAESSTSRKGKEKAEPKERGG
ncbi:hypothetical protein JOM56_014307 [Amanita muscaria]